MTQRAFHTRTLQNEAARSARSMATRAKLAATVLLMTLIAGLLAACVDVTTGPLSASLTDGDKPGPQGADSSDNRRQLWLIPSPRQSLLMRAYLYRPPGEGPFPLAVINHGSDQDLGARAAMPMPSFPDLTKWFLARGYAVLLPQRPGHGQTGGPYLEDQGFCQSPNYVSAGNATADSIAAAVDYMTRQPFIRPTGAVIFGNSAGGWGTLALAARNPPAVSAAVVFSAGRGGRDHGRAFQNCAPDRLVAAAGAYGRTARVPVLWLSASNDTFFAPELVARMTAAYKAGGGVLDYHLLPPVGTEGHALAMAPEATWGPYLAAFLKK